MFFSIFERGIITSLPHFVQRILKSIPTRKTTNSLFLQGCSFLVIIISAANIPLKKITFPLPEATASQASLTEMQCLSAQYIYSYTLAAQNINFKEIYVCTDNSNDNSIVITKVIIVSDEPREKIIEALGVLAKEREVEIVNE